MLDTEGFVHPRQGYDNHFFKQDASESRLCSVQAHFERFRFAMIRIRRAVLL
jgi:hypothetical protein